MNISTSALNSSMNNINNAAYNLANINNADTNVDLAKEMTDIEQNKHAFEANLKVIKTKDEMLGQILDILT